jgi:hypothetical protein
MATFVVCVPSSMTHQVLDSTTQVGSAARQDVTVAPYCTLCTAALSAGTPTAGLQLCSGHAPELSRCSDVSVVGEERLLSTTVNRGLARLNRVGIW